MTQVGNNTTDPAVFQARVTAGQTTVADSKAEQKDQQDRIAALERERNNIISAPEQQQPETNGQAGQVQAAAKAPAPDTRPIATLITQHEARLGKAQGDENDAAQTIVENLGQLSIALQQQQQQQRGQGSDVVATNTGGTNNANGRQQQQQQQQVARNPETRAVSGTSGMT